MKLLDPVRRIQAHREIAASRKRADDELALTRLPSPRLAWRVHELVDPQNRRELAHSLAEVVRSSGGRYLPSASPLNRGAARDEVDLLLRIAAMLADADAPVRPRGVVLVDRLLSDGSSPLYARNRARELRGALASALEALEAPR